MASHAPAEWQAVWNEALATAFFTFIGAGTTAVTGNVAFEELLPPRLALISATQGVSYSVLLYFTSLVAQGGIGFMNPAITFAVLITNHAHGRYSWKTHPMLRAVFFMIAQVVGATAGTLLIMATVPNSNTGREQLGAPRLGYGSTTWSAMAFEALCTFFLTWVVLGNIARRDLRSKTVSAPVAIGLALTAMTLFSFPFTGACFNPARALGPAFVTLDFTDALVHTVAPFVGALTGAVLYGLVFTNEDNILGLSSAHKNK